MIKKMTVPTKADAIKRVWHIIDLKGKTLGRVSTEIAGLLMGKAKPYFIKNLDCGDYVVAINAKDIKVTGKKEDQKNYYRHSGYPGGFRQQTLAQVREAKPEDIITHAVKGMLPKNRLQDTMLKRLRVFEDEKHSFGDKFKKSELNARS